MGTARTTKGHPGPRRCYRPSVARQPVSQHPPFPPPLRTDGSNAFARQSVQLRLPVIAREVIARNPRFPQAVKDDVERLAVAVEGDEPLPVPRAPALDLPGWLRAHGEHAGESWLSTQWFHAEFAFYLEIGRRCRFWETGVDPFEPAKQEELANERLWERLAVALARRGPREERLAGLLDDGLWANRVDLSYAIAASRPRADDDLIADDRALATPWLARPGARVHIAVDNTGTELALDLALIDAILDDPAASVAVHLKMEPIFVSDAMPRDLWTLVDRMHARGSDARKLAERLRAAADLGRLALVPDPFWSSPRFLYEAPPHVATALSGATIAIFKGDANYRRVVGDAIWEPTEPFARACGDLRAPLVALRTMKSDPVLGLAAGVAERLAAEDPRWRVEGRRGVIQAFVPAAR
jgi:hypothetical protein